MGTRRRALGVDRGERRGEQGAAVRRQLAGSVVEGGGQRALVVGELTRPRQGVEHPRALIGIRRALEKMIERMTTLGEHQLVDVLAGLAHQAEAEHRVGSKKRMRRVVLPPAPAAVLVLERGEPLEPAVQTLGQRPLQALEAGQRVGARNSFR